MSKRAPTRIPPAQRRARSPIWRRGPLAPASGALATLALLAVACGSHPAETVRLPDGSPGLPAVVVHVVDGDTIDLRLPGGRQERARLLGIDTPETVKPDTPVECFGPEASNRTKHLLAPGTKVLIARDREPRDRYGRLLAYVWRRRDGLFVNRSLVQDGFASLLEIAPNTAMRTELRGAAADAQRRRVGMWATCPPAA